MLMVYEPPVFIVVGFYTFFLLHPVGIAKRSKAVSCNLTIGGSNPSTDFIFDSSVILTAIRGIAPLRTYSLMG